MGLEKFFFCCLVLNDWFSLFNHNYKLFIFQQLKISCPKFGNHNLVCQLLALFGTFMNFWVSLISGTTVIFFLIPLWLLRSQNKLSYPWVTLAETLDSNKINSWNQWHVCIIFNLIKGYQAFIWNRMKSVQVTVLEPNGAMMWRIDDRWPNDWWPIWLQFCYVKLRKICLLSQSNSSFVPPLQYDRDMVMVLVWLSVHP